MKTFKISRRNLFALIISVLILCLGIVIALGLKVTRTLPKPEPTATENGLNIDAKSPLNLSDRAAPITVAEAKKLVQDTKPNNAAEYISINNSGLPEAETNALKRDFDNLSQFGSFSGGKITHEFSQTAYFRLALLKHGGLNRVLAGLNFTPIDISVLLGDDFKLIGADFSGAFHEGKFNSIFRSYKGNDGKRFEINEMYLNPDNNVKLSIYIESINFDLLGYPATFQRLKNSDNKDVFDLDFNLNKRAFSISSEGLSYAEFLEVAIKIARAAEENAVWP